MTVDNANLKDNLTQYFKILNRISRASKELTLLLEESEADFDPRKAKKSIAELEKQLQNLKGKEANLVESLQQLIGEANSRIQQLVAQKRNRLGVELEKQLANIGLKLEGHYPELKAGLFTIEIDFDGNKAVLWYGPKQEKLRLCPLSPEKIVKNIAELRSALGSKLERDAFLKKLYKAYLRASKGKEDVPIPILEVMRELAFLLQPSAFYIDPRRENYRSYGRADFSYDLFRLGSVQNLRLVTATRAFTKSRSKFLWVPHNETGAGATYSHLKLKGNLEFK